ncbi:MULTISPECIES: hypothetical protein [Streptomyces]|nr:MULTISPECIES: hypothetical protein [Streptomyces]
MEEWVDPQYAELVAYYRQQQETPTGPAYGLPVDDVPVRGLVIEPMPKQ